MAIGLGALIGLGTSLIGSLFGGSQKRQANRLEANNPFPTAQVNQNLVENLAIAEQAAQVGLPQQQYTNAIQNLQRNQNAAFRQGSRSGGTGSAASILRATNGATANLDIADAAARQQNEQLAMQQRGVLAQEENRVWDWNERQKYIQAMQQVQALRGAGNQNIFGAIGNVAQMGISGLFGGGGGTANGVGSLLGGIFGGGQQQQNGQIQQVLPGAQIQSQAPQVPFAQTMGIQGPTNPFGVQQLPFGSNLFQQQ